MADAYLVDPLGRHVELSDATWYGHIIRNHREMAMLRPQVERTISAPTEVRLSASDADCRLFYGPSPRDGLMICVVADIVAGCVKTAYLARRVKQGEVEWP